MSAVVYLAVGVMGILFALISFSGMQNDDPK
jgi:glycopeptide antibiotics resistance protein